MKRNPDFRWLWRVAILAVGLILVTAACSSDDTPDLGTPDDQISDSTTTTTGGGVSDAPVDDAPPPAAAGDDRGAELVGRWEVSNYKLPDGALTNVVGADPVFMEFNADGTLSYNTGCNGGATAYVTSGSYLVPTSALDDTPEGQPITIGPSFEQTEIGCEGFLGDQDLDFPADMAATTRFRVDDDQLLLLDEFLLIEATKAG